MGVCVKVFVDVFEGRVVGNLVAVIVEALVGWTVMELVGKDAGVTACIEAGGAHPAKIMAPMARRHKVLN